MELPVVEYQKKARKLTLEVVDTFIKSVYAYKDKRVEIEWNFSMDGEGS